MSARQVRWSDAVAVEGVKLFRRPPLYALLGVEAVVLVAVALAVRVAPVVVGEARPSVLELAVPFGALAGQVFAAMAGAALAQEYGWRTLPLSLARGVPRGRWLLARFATQVPALVLVAAVPLAVGVLLSSGALQEALAAAGLRAAGLVLVPLAVAAGMLPYLALAFLLAVGGRSVAVAVGGVLMTALLVEQLLAQFVHAVAPYLPSAFAGALLSGAGVGRAWAAVGLAAYALAFLVATTVWMARQDLGG